MRTIAFLAALALAGCGASSGGGTPHAPITTWSDAAAPQIVYGQMVATMVWNDPCVIKEGAGYRMWLSGGVPGSNPIVRVYEATSPDGMTWTISPTAEISEGAGAAWDSQRIETPMVAKVGSTYHLYYSGGTASEVAAGRYRLGHATSSDGMAWTKDLANPVLGYHSDSDPVHWGFYTTAEPAMVYDPVTAKYFVYYTTIKARPGYSGDLGSMYGIGLAISSDGSSFTHYDADADGFDDVVLQQSAAYPVSADYVGYSTPYALIDSDHVFHLFYDVVRYPSPGDWRQVAIAHATSHDGIHFTEVQTDILVNGGSTWHSWEVRAPSVLKEGASFKLWFAGHGGTNDWTTSGIGLAVSATNFQ